MTDLLTGVTVADWLLALIPASLLLGILAGLVTSLSMMFALGVGSVPASGLVGYALFCTSPQK